MIYAMLNQTHRHARALKIREGFMSSTGKAANNTGSTFSAQTTGSTSSNNADKHADEFAGVKKLFEQRQTAWKNGDFSVSGNRRPPATQNYTDHLHNHFWGGNGN
jgi:hypothetical protein